MCVQYLDNATPGLFYAQARKLAGQAGHSAIGRDGYLEGQLVLIPPFNICHIAERAAHNGASTFLRVCLHIRQYRHLESEQGYGYMLADQFLIACVIWMNEHRHTGRQQFRPGSGNRKCLPVLETKSQGDEFTLALEVVQLCLRNGSATHRAPDGWGLAAIG